MIEEYQYRPPLKYLFLGLSELAVAAIFGISIIKSDELWFSIICAVFFLINLGASIGLLTIFIRNYNVGNLEIGDNFIVIPGRWKEKTRLEFKDITSTGEIDTYDQLIKIESKNGFHLIERNWMKQADFDSVKVKLKESFLNKDDLTLEE